MLIMPTNCMDIIFILGCLITSMLVIQLTHLKPSFALLSFILGLSFQTLRRALNKPGFRKSTIKILEEGEEDPGIGSKAATAVSHHTLPQQIFQNHSLSYFSVNIKFILQLNYYQSARQRQFRDIYDTLSSAASKIIRFYFAPAPANVARFSHTLPIFNHNPFL